MDVRIGVIEEFESAKRVNETLHELAGGIAKPKLPNINRKDQLKLILSKFTRNN